VDEYGLKIPVYSKMVLVIVPPRDYAETTMRYTRSKLFNVDVGSRVVSTQEEELIHGHLQDEFQPEAVIADQEMRDYGGLILCAGPGVVELFDDEATLRLIREAAQQAKPIGAWGDSTALLAKAGIVEKRRVTGDSAQRETLAQAGAIFTGAQVEVDGLLVTADGESSGLRFAIALQKLLDPKAK